MPRARKPSARGLADSVVPYLATPSASNGRGALVKGLQKMREVTWVHYSKYLDTYETVLVEGKDIRLEGGRRVETFGPERDEEQQTTVWSFPNRGNWATHKASYRGNWSPWVPRNLILKYSQPGRYCARPDGWRRHNPCRMQAARTPWHRRGHQSGDSLMLAMDRLNFDLPPEKIVRSDELPPEIKLFEGDARSLNAIPSDSVDLITTHPPYANIIPYSQGGTNRG